MENSGQSGKALVMSLAKDLEFCFNRPGITPEKTVWRSLLTQKDSADGAIPGGPDSGQPIKAGDDHRLTLVRSFFSQLTKSIKTIALHRHAVQQYGEFLKPAWQALEAVLQTTDSLSLNIDQTAFRYNQDPVYEEEASDQNIAFKFYRDRVRLLIFRRGITEQELLDFVLICLSNVKPGDPFQDDMVSMMWAKDFRHIDYVRVESFSLGDESSDLTKQDVDKVVAYLYQRLTSVNKDSFQFARLSLEDLDLVLENVDKAYGLTVEGVTAKEGQQAAILDQIEKDEKERLLPRIIGILLAAFTEELDDELGQVMENSFVQLFDSFLLLEDFDGIDQIFRDFRSLEQRQIPASNGDWINRIFGRLVARMGDQETIQKMAEIMEMTADQKMHERIRRYLVHLKTPATVPILDALERINRKEAREVLCEALAVHGRADMDLFVSRLGSKKANLVRDMLSVLDRLNPPEKIKHVASLLSHPNLAIRMEAIKSIGASSDKEAIKYLTNALKDDDAQVRATAALILPKRDKLFARAQLLPVVQKSDFKDRPDREQVSFFTALTLTESQEVFDFFSQQIQTTGLLGRKRLLEFKRNIINGVAGADTEAAGKFLAALLESGVKDKEVLSTAERAQARLMERIKDTETGE
jgi:hypothetical protein